MKKIIIFFVILIFLLVSILLYSRYIGTKGLNIKEYKITYQELNKEFYGLKIVHLSDILYGKTINKEELEEIVSKVNLTKPDIVVLTGDLLSNSNIKEDELIELLSKIEARIGKFAIKGDNDNDNWENIINSSDFKNLNDTYDLIYTSDHNYLLIAGISSNANDSNIDQKLQSTYDFINSSEIKPNYSILIMHEPDFIDKINYDSFNLVLAGHSLGGQIKIPFIGALIKPKNGTKYYNDYYEIKKTKLFVSSGLGTNKYSFRLNNHPSFNLYRLTN